MHETRIRFLLNHLAYSARRPQIYRSEANVAVEYDEGWAKYAEDLDRSDTLEAWLNIPQVDIRTRYYNIEGRLRYESFNPAKFNREVLLGAFRKHFPAAKSFTEYGCGVGRNLLFLKREMPDIDFFGYELCAPGVEIARAAARKFGVDVKYEQLNFLSDPGEKYAFPISDVAFTVFALEQIPRASQHAVRNMLEHAKLGTVHIEPVPENYPFSLRGLIGRIDHRKADYLSGFDRSVRALSPAAVHVEPVGSAHNPLMFPSLYVLRKQ